FVLTLSGFPPGFPSVFPTLSDLSDPISSVLSRFSLRRFRFRFSFPAVQTLAGFFRLPDQSIAGMRELIPR
ncbi:hypothetical protein ACF1BB_24270, partial [Streptomyces griseoluteus]|uniref:hypothetical protein n=1 Tax=Streptomyces griseoluteus TaxID=29306 RepID=UPI0036FBC8AF